MASRHGPTPRGIKTHEAVADTIRRQIVLGRFKVGDRLPTEEDLTEQFEVARTTLREALRVLESQGLIEIRRGRNGGPVVTEPPSGATAESMALLLQMKSTTIGEIDQVRHLIESQIVRDLTRTRNRDDIATLRSIIDDAQEATKAEDHDAFAEHVRLFNMALMSRNKNRALITTAQVLREMIVDYLNAFSFRATSPMMRKACRSYTRLVDLIEDGDADAAEAHWRALKSVTVVELGPDQPLNMYQGRPSR
jgi:DNA-binding FadR family transcriptional regulator